MVNEWVLLQDLNESGEGGRVDWHDVSSTTLHVLAVRNAADGGVVFGVAVARVNADGAENIFASWFQNRGTTKHQVGDDLGIWKVVGVGAYEKELRQAEMLGEGDVSDLGDSED